MRRRAAPAAFSNHRHDPPLRQSESGFTEGEPTLEHTIAELPSFEQLARVTFRLLMAAMLGGLVGAEREWVGRAAGLRTHMVVALGSAVFVLIPVETGATTDSVTSVIHGVATGVGFIGAGTILKAADQREVQGLTTAATIWLTGALGIAVGVGHWWLAAVGVAIAWTILAVLSGLSRRLQAKAEEDGNGQST